MAVVATEDKRHASEQPKIVSKQIASITTGHILNRYSVHISLVLTLLLSSEGASPRTNCWPTRSSLGENRTRLTFIVLVCARASPFGRLRALFSAQSNIYRIFTIIINMCTAHNLHHTHPNDNHSLNLCLKFIFMSSILLRPDLITNANDLNWIEKMCANQPADKYPCLLTIG